MTKQFDIGDILSITTERLVSPRGIEGVYGILSFMAGENIYTHQLPRIGDEAKPELLRQHPFLISITAPDWEIKRNGAEMEQVIQAWVSSIAVQHGEYLAVSPMAMDDHALIDPVVELAAMVEPKKIIVAQL